ncbi:MAG: DUF4388 domain-containing protein [Desulfobacteraceae bacterium]|nr:DUF4388 domain-containing protein [Desulfobacteraceae bacterium]
MKKETKTRSRRLLDLFLKDYPNSSRFAEAFRTLRTNIHFSFMDKAFRSILITSAGEKEGKTSTAANLAYTLAQAGKSVLMIDADLRKPMLGKLIPSQESQGLTGLLSNLFGISIENGSLTDFGTGDMVNLLSLQKKTGLLYLFDGKDRMNFYFLHGELVHIKWVTKPENKSLINFLVEGRLLDKEDSETVAGRQRDTGQDISSILINMGILKREDLKGPLNLYMTESIRIATQMKAGEFYFKELPESDLERFSSDLVNIHQIYREAVVGDEKMPFLEQEISSAILEVSDGLFLLQSGNLPPNPSELLGSERMSFLISYLQKKFDVLLIDTPPILPASDALLLAPQLDGVVLMVKAGHMDRELVKKAVEQLQVAKANILGVVLNQIDVKREGYYRYYKKYYSGYYGESKYDKVRETGPDTDPPDHNPEDSDRKLNKKPRKKSDKFVVISNPIKDNGSNGLINAAGSHL